MAKYVSIRGDTYKKMKEAADFVQTPVCTYIADICDRFFEAQKRPGNGNGNGGTAIRVTPSKAETLTRRKH